MSNPRWRQTGRNCPPSWHQPDFGLPGSRLTSFIARCLGRPTVSFARTAMAASSSLLSTERLKATASRAFARQQVVYGAPKTAFSRCLAGEEANLVLSFASSIWSSRSSSSSSGWLTLMSITFEKSMCSSRYMMSPIGESQFYHSRFAKAVSGSSRMLGNPPYARPPR